MPHLLLSHLRRTLPRPRRRARVVLAGAICCFAALTTNVGAQRGSDPDTVRAIEQAIDSLRRHNDHAALARAYHRLAELHTDIDSTAKAIDEYRRSIVHASHAGDSATLAKSHNGLGLLHWAANRYDSALTNLSRSRAIRERTGDRKGLGLVLNSIGASYYQLGQYEPALTAFLQSLAISRETGESSRVGITLTNIGKTYHDFLQYDRAQEVLEEALRVADSIQAPLVRGYTLHTLGVLQMDRGRLAEARTYFSRSLIAYADPSVSRSDSLSGWAMNAVVMGLLKVREGDPAGAVHLLDSTYAMAVRRQSVRGQARSLLYLGEAYRALGRYPQAIDVLERSVALSRSVEQRVFALEAVTVLSRVEEDAGRTAAALRHLRVAHALRDTIFSQSTAHRIAAMEARDATEREQRENARLRAEQAIQREVIARQRSVVMLGALVLLLTLTLLALVYHFLQKGKVREALLERINADLARTNRELQSALSEVRTLTGLIPICSSCKKVRDDRGYWEAVETYISSRSSATFSHGICSSCGPTLYGEHWPHDIEEAVAEDL